MKIEILISEFLQFKYVGNRHFDWSYIEERYPAEMVVTLLREPISRAISHFDYMKTLSWTKGMPIRTQNMDQFLHDPASMLDCRGLWQDGQVSESKAEINTGSLREMTSKIWTLPFSVEFSGPFDDNLFHEFFHQKIITVEGPFLQLFCSDPFSHVLARPKKQKKETHRFQKIMTKISDYFFFIWVIFLQKRDIFAYF